MNSFKIDHLLNKTQEELFKNLRNVYRSSKFQKVLIEKFNSFDSKFEQLVFERSDTRIRYLSNELKLNYDSIKRLLLQNEFENILNLKTGSLFEYCWVENLDNDTIEQVRCLILGSGRCMY